MREGLGRHARASRAVHFAVVALPRVLVREYFDVHRVGTDANVLAIRVLSERQRSEVWVPRDLAREDVVVARNVDELPTAAIRP